jgi:hypothetical protein
MKFKKLSWYQTGIISLIGIFFLGNWAIDKEIARRDLRVIQINMPQNTRHKRLSTEFDLTSIDLLKSKPQIRCSIDSLEKVGSIIKKYKEIYDTTHVLTVCWNDKTRLQQIVSLLDTLKKVKYNRFVIVPNGTECMIPFYFPKPTKEFFDGNFGGCCISVFYPEPQNTFQQNFDMIFRDYIWVWVLFGGLIICVFWKTKRIL